MAWAFARGLLMVSLAVACGGRTEGYGGESAEGDGEPSAPAKEQPSGGGSKTSGSDPVLDGETPLGDCTLGFKPWDPQGRTCPWLADDLCYESRQMACNCICPRDHDSRCASGFEGGPNGKVEVYCR